MRNSLFKSILFAAFMALLPALLIGCAQDKQAKAELTEGYAALDAQQYDQAISQADAYLNAHPTGAGTAEALYLRGRAFEIKVARNPGEAKSNLQSARSAYIEALSRNPAPKLEALIHTSLANVAYFQDDYANAAQEWTIAYDKLDDESTKSWVLYRIGLCKQRLNQFSDADQIFANVQQRYPNTDPARRAKEHQGARSFSVQLATYASAASADTAVASLARDGVKATKQAAAGRTVVVAGPFSSYQQALSLKARYATTYPDAIIRP